MKDYQEIKIQGQTLAFEEDKADEIVEVTLDDVVEPVVEDEGDENPTLIAETKEPAPKADNKPKESRAKKRIQQLHSEKLEALRLAEQERLEKEALRKELMELQKGSTVDMAKTLEEKATVLTKQLTEAIRNGDAEETVRIQDELITTKMELASKKHAIKTIEATPEIESPKPKQPVNTVPEKALEWVETYPQFKTDELFHTSSIVINNQLIKEGFDPESDEFYEELTERLSPRFPEVFGIKDKTKVELKAEDTPSEEEQPDVKPKAVKRAPQQTVSSSSRPSNPGAVPPKKLASISMSPADIAQINRWGLDVNQIARRMAHMEKNESNGYTPIMIDKN
jgi:hypothetical protein